MEHLVELVVQVLMYLQDLEQRLNLFILQTDLYKEYQQEVFLLVEEEVEHQVVVVHPLHLEAMEDQVEVVTVVIRQVIQETEMDIQEQPTLVVEVVEVLIFHQVQMQVETVDLV